jgi:hypothetical protein
MKRFAMILLGCALIMGMSQCKKDNTTTPNNEGVRITLTADNGQNSKTSISGDNFYWKSEVTEYIYVGCDRYDGCIGELTAIGNGTSRVTFSGTLSQTPQTGDKLYFFYLGNGKHEGATSVSFASQTGNHDDVTNHHIAIGEAFYNGSGSYTATLNMAMAIAWFNTSAFGSPSSITLSGTGICNTATINYKEGTITASNGNIVISNGVSSDCYVALLPYHIVGDYMLNFSTETQTGGIIFKQEIYPGDFYESLTGGTPGPLVVTPSPGK